MLVGLFYIMGILRNGGDRVSLAAKLTLSPPLYTHYIKRIAILYTHIERGRIVVIEEACPPADTGSGRGPLTASYRAAMTQMTMGGSGVSEANGVLLNHYCPPGVKKSD